MFRCCLPRGLALLAALLLDTQSGSAQTNLGLVSPMFPGNGNTYYGLSSAEVVFTVDGGVAWNPIFIFPPGLSQQVSALAVDPNNKAILYAGVPLTNGAVMKSSDSGTTWAKSATGLPSGTGSIESLQISRSDSRIVYARTGNLVFKTADSGGSWTRQSTLPAQTGFLDIGMADSRRWVFASGLTINYSSDEGLTWRPATLNLGTGGGSVGPDIQRTVSALISSPHDSNLVFAAVTDNVLNRSANVFGIYRSSDGGGTFAKTDGLNAFVNSAAYVQSILIDARASTSLVTLGNAGDSYVCRSDDNYSSAAKCSQTGAFKLEPGDALKLAPQVVASDPQISGLFYGFNSGGFCQSKDFGATWSCTKGDLIPTLRQPVSPLQFRLSEGTQSTASWAATLVESRSAKLPFTLTMPDDPWLTLNPLQGNTNDTTVSLTARATLPPGVTRTNFMVRSAATANSALTIPVDLTVLPRDPNAPRYVVGTIAGKGAAGAINEGGPALNSSVTLASQMITDKAGVIWYSEAGRIRKIDTNGIVTTVVGNGTTSGNFSGAGGTATAAGIGYVGQFALDSQGNLYFTSLSDPPGIWKVSGKTVTMAYPGNLKVDDRTCTFEPIYCFPPSIQFPAGLAIDSQNRIWVSTTLGLIRIDTNGAATQIYKPPASIGSLGKLFFDASGNLISADYGHVVQITPDFRVKILAGSATDTGFNGDGLPGPQTLFGFIEGAAIDAQGTLYIADAGSNRVRRLPLNGAVMTIAGTGTRAFETPAEGALAADSPVHPYSVAIHPDGSILVGEPSAIQKLIPDKRPLPVISDISLPLAPGSIFRIAGANLSGNSVGASFNGGLAKILSSDAGSVNGIVPIETKPGRVAVAVIVNQLASVTSVITLQPAAPVIQLTADGSRAAATNADGSNNSADSPAPVGATVTVMLTGTGLVDSSGSPLLPVSGTLAGQPLDSLSVTLARGMPGMAVATFNVPAVDPGDQPLILQIGDFASQPANLAVTGPQ